MARPDNQRRCVIMRKLQGSYQVQLCSAGLLFAAAVWPGLLAAEPVDVRYAEGSVHGFVVLRSLDNKLLADGDVTQTVEGDRVTTRLAFNFKDGSTHEQTTVYSQRQSFRLISDKIVQKGPAFPQPLEMAVDGMTGNVTVRYQDEHGQSHSESETFDVPPDLANGIVTKLLMNARPEAMPKSFSLIAATPKPRMVKLAITPGSRERFSIGGGSRQATHHVLKVEIGGVAGVVAPLIGKEPPDVHVWIAGGEVPAFVRAEQPLYADGPVWRIELAGPVWPKTPPAPTAKADPGKKRPPA
jgi:hypothetical protein